MNHFFHASKPQNKHNRPLPVKMKNTRWACDTKKSTRQQHMMQMKKQNKLEKNRQAVMDANEIQTRMTGLSIGRDSVLPISIIYSFSNYSRGQRYFQKCQSILYLFSLRGYSGFQEYDFRYSYLQEMYNKERLFLRKWVIHFIETMMSYQYSNSSTAKKHAMERLAQVSFHGCSSLFLVKNEDSRRSHYEKMAMYVDFLMDYQYGKFRETPVHGSLYYKTIMERERNEEIASSMKSVFHIPLSPPNQVFVIRDVLSCILSDNDDDDDDDECCATTINNLSMSDQNKNKKKNKKKKILMTTSTGNKTTTRSQQHIPSKEKIIKKCCRYLIDIYVAAISNSVSDIRQLLFFKPSIVPNLSSVCVWMNMTMCHELAFVVACESRALHVVEELLVCKKVNVRFGEDICLRKACQQGDVELVQLLLLHHADARVYDYEPFCIACAYNHMDVLQCLLTHLSNHDSHAINIPFFNALRYACLGGFLQCVRLLLQFIVQHPGCFQHLSTTIHYNYMMCLNIALHEGFVDVVALLMDSYNEIAFFVSKHYITTHSPYPHIGRYGMVLVDHVETQMDVYLCSCYCENCICLRRKMTNCWQQQLAIRLRSLDVYDTNADEWIASHRSFIQNKQFHLTDGVKDGMNGMDGISAAAMNDIDTIMALSASKSPFCIYAKGQQRQEQLNRYMEVCMVFCKPEYPLLVSYVYNGHLGYYGGHFGYYGGYAANMKTKGDEQVYFLALDDQRKSWLVLKQLWQEWQCIEVILESLHSEIHNNTDLMVTIVLECIVQKDLEVEMAKIINEYPIPCLSDFVLMLKGEHMRHKRHHQIPLLSHFTSVREWAYEMYRCGLYWETLIEKQIKK